ncbi:hypothetical protein BIW11_09686 [Tropilaelaps mercedesae]|uniref:Transmembrane protein n=1 Tax=Tropilaelaps mercedesae TaxID=418985 RepID=A0A1V9XJE6_9ACAR|nr:hypothetical protein BIW11_09686 [Tropilaelaps mercedesae]
MAKSAVFSPIRFVAILKRRLKKNEDNKDNNQHFGGLIQGTQIVTAAQKSGKTGNIVPHTKIAMSEFDKRTTFAQLEEASIEDLGVKLSSRKCWTQPMVPGRRIRPRMFRGAVSQNGIHAIAMCHQNFSRSFRDCRIKTGNANANTSIIYNRDSKKKGLASFNSKIRLLMTLLPLLQETLSLFDDLFMAAVNCVVKGKTAFSSATQHVHSHLAFGLTVVAILKLELVLEYLFWGSVLVFWLRPPRIFRPPRRLYRLPAISARMCHTFQGVVYCGTVCLKILFFHGGISSLVTWTIFAAACKIVQLIGLIWLLKLVCVAFFVLRIQAPNFCRELRTRCNNALKTT